MIIAVGGSGAKAGKTAFCKILLDYLVQDWQYLSTSETLILELSGQKKISVEEILQNKEKYRQDLINLSRKDPLWPITRTLLKWDQNNHLLFESVRRHQEFTILDKPGTIFIYVYASTKIREARGASGPDINDATDCMFSGGEVIPNCFYVDNQRTIKDLQKRALTIARIVAETYLK